MRRYIIPIICYVLIIAILLNINEITDFLAKTISNNQVLTIADGNEYTKDYGFSYVKNSEDYIPYTESDLLDIIFSVINQGWNEFTFYCPSEYEECQEDITRITKDELILTHINNFVHPYNSFYSLKTSITESGEITINVIYLYKDEEKEIINEYVDNLIKEFYKKEDDDYSNLERIHDYIIENTKYDVERNDTGKSDYESYNAMGPVKDGYATCNGYADLMAIILSKLGYENYKIATTKEEISYESNGHVWNAVKVKTPMDNGTFKDEWVHLDLTWDDPVSSDGKDYIHHKYFLVNTEALKKADQGNVNVEEHNFNKAIYQEFMVTE